MMRRVIGLVSVLLACCGMAAAQELLKNPGFEEGTTGWGNFWAQSGSLATDRCHSGKNAVKIAHPEPMQSGWYQENITGLEPGAVYRVTVYTFRDAATVTPQVWLLTRWVYPHGAPRFRSTTGRSATQVNAWELQSGEIITNPDGVLSLNLFVNGKGTVWFDDVTLKMVKSRKQRQVELLAITTAPAAKAGERAAAWLELGQIALWTDKDAATALDDYRAALTLLPDDKITGVTAYANLAEIYRQQQAYDKLLDSYCHLLELDQDGSVADGGARYMGRQEVIKSMRDIADALTRQGDVDRALAYYQAVLPAITSDKSATISVLQSIANIHHARGDAVRETEALGRIADLNNLLANPRFENGMTGWGNFWAQSGSWSTDRVHAGKGSARISHNEAKASGWYQENISGLQPGALYRVQVYVYRDTDAVTANVWLLSGWWRAGAPLFHAINGEPTKTVNEWELLSGELQVNGDGKMSVNLFVKGKGNVWFDDASLTMIRTKDERKADLLKVATNAAAKPADRMQAYLDLGQLALWGDKDYVSARDYYRKALELQAEDNRMRIILQANLAEIYSRQQDIPNALASYHQLLELDPDGAAGADGQLYIGRKGVLNAMIELYRQQKDYASALVTSNRLLDSLPKGRPESRKVLYGIYDLYKLQGKLAEAKGILARIADEAAPPAVKTPPPDPIRWRLLSDNRRFLGPNLQTGATYAWERPPTNPPDVTPGTQAPGRRLLDGDDEVLGTADTAVGWDAGDNAVTFDFRAPYRIARVRLRFVSRIPKSVGVLGADSLATRPEGTNWISLGTMATLGENWNELTLPATPRARFLKLVIKQPGGGVTMREVQIIGLRPGEATPAKPPAVKMRGTGANAQLVLAEAGRPCCAVVVDGSASRKVIIAAWFLRDTLSRMTGSDIPIYDVREAPAGTRLIVGGNALADRVGVRLAQTYPDGERYRIHRVGNDIVLLGNDAQSFDGTAMAVMDFLQRLGCGWYAPDPLWQVIPTVTSLAVPARLAVDERPQFRTRIMWPGRLTPLDDWTLRMAWRLGGQEMWIGHVLSSLVPDEVRKDHPDWFGAEQPCLTNPEVQRYIIDQFREKLDSAPGQFLFFSISANDGAGFCQCTRCQQAGNTSAASMLFANAIADALRETHPGRFQLGFIAYWVTCNPPKPIVTGKPEVVVMLADNHQLTKPRTAAHWTDWLETGSLNGVYEWWIPACNRPEWQRIPWYPGEAAMRNLRYWQKNGIRYLEYETGTGEAGDGFPLIRWPLYYLGARGAWDSKGHADDILREACRKLFGKAAESMLNYYRTLETAMRDTPYPGSLWGLPLAERVYTPAVVTKASGFLAAAAAQAVTPAERARVAGERDRWNQAKKYVTERNAMRNPKIVTTITGTLRWRDVPVVKVYQAPPFRYEELGRIQLPLDPAQRDREAVDNAIEALKKECAELGANGLLLTEAGDQNATVAGKALYVIEE